jgi:hypothetical protein
MKQVLASILYISVIAPGVLGQTIGAFVPEKPDASQKFLFYLHGGIIQEQGINAISPRFGAYEYMKILDTLRRHGFNVISEARPRGTDEVAYARKVSKQIDTLINRGVAPENIVVVGASQGAYIAIELARQLKNSRISYAILALCSAYALDYFLQDPVELCGNFLSIYENSDSKGSCDKLLAEQYCKTGYKEIRLSMGNGHGFIYKPYREWVMPLVKWAGGVRGR